MNTYGNDTCNIIRISRALQHFRFSICTLNALMGLFKCQLLQLHWHFISTALFHCMFHFHYKLPLPLYSSTLCIIQNLFAHSICTR